jgi:hypothetical protein
LNKLRKFYRTKKGQLLLDLDFPCGERGTVVELFAGGIEEIK